MSDRAPFVRESADVVARQGETLITTPTFLSAIEELAERLPDRPYVVNLCDDRYHFTVAWGAAMLRGQVTLLPSSRDPAAVAALRADYPALYLLNDDETIASGAPFFAYPKLPVARSSRVPAFPPDQIAAVLFTSGSTGRPTPNPRSWGRLVSISLAAGAALGVRRFPGATLVATVPHGHSYGLESAVMLPLQHGLLLTAERPFFPADVATAMRGNHQPAERGNHQPAILITTPVHLRALVGDAATTEPGPGFGAPIRAGFVLSATAPLATDLAAQAETTFQAPVFEIYGCSEAGQIATRRTIDGPAWRPLDGLHLRQDPSGTWVSGPHEAEVLLADQIEMTPPGGFILQGRTADMVNIAGKRSSLAYLARQLTAIDGVEDGVFLMPEKEFAGVSPRLTAVAVAPRLDAAAVLAALRGRIDPAFLPRPLHVVSSLPRNALGKLPRADILRLIAATPAASTPIIVHIPADHPAGPGHFPGDPIVPGAVLLDEVVNAICPGAARLENAKFHHPVRPGEALTVTHRTEGAATRFECRIVGSDRLALSGVLRSPFQPR